MFLPMEFLIRMFNYVGGFQWLAVHVANDKTRLKLTAERVINSLCEINV